MWQEGRGGGTSNPMLWVFASRNTAAMGFNVSQAVWDYLEHHSLDLVYNRKAVQDQLDTIQALLTGPSAPFPAASSAVAAAVRRTSIASRVTPLGWVLGGVVVAVAGALAAYSRTDTQSG